MKWSVQVLWIAVQAQLIVLAAYVLIPLLRISARIALALDNGIKALERRTVQLEEQMTVLEERKT